MVVKNFQCLETADLIHIYYFQPLDPIKNFSKAQSTSRALCYMIAEVLVWIEVQFHAGNLCTLDYWEAN